MGDIYFLKKVSSWWPKKECQIELSPIPCNSAMGSDETCSECCLRFPGGCDDGCNNPSPSPSPTSIYPTATSTVTEVDTITITVTPNPSPTSTTTTPTPNPSPTSTTTTPTPTPVPIGQCGGSVPLIPGTGCPLECLDEDGDGVDSNVINIYIYIYTYIIHVVCHVNYILIMYLLWMYYV